ncbi:MAG: LCP family protein required for cell wall assembly [Nitriliruptoraceae bacterium]|jgi:LCP family protein required for cell wall assembly
MSDVQPPTPTSAGTPATPQRGSVPPSADDNDWLPPSRGGASTRHVGRWIAVALVIMLLLPVAYGGALAMHGASSVTRLDVTGLATAGEVTNILVVGSDSRDDLSPQERKELTTGGEVGPERTDTILLLSTRGTDVAILSFPRDLWVDRCGNGPQRINTAVQVGGLSCLADTITTLSGIPVHHVVQVSFGGFRDVVDAVGGVEVCLEQAINDKDAGIDLPAGCQQLDGADALGYVRVRKIDDDLQRIARQQQFLTVLAKQIMQPATLLVPSRGWQTVGSLGSAISADGNLGTGPMVGLAFAAKGLAAGNAVRATVPTTPTSINGAAVLLEGADAAALYSVFRDGSVLDLVGEAAGDAAARADTNVVILNGAGVGGLAATTSAALSALGYPDARLGNAERARITTVQHPPQLQAAAERLADDLAGFLGVRPTVRAGADGAALTLLLGTDIPG